MSENEVKGSLNDVDSLNDAEKKQFADMGYLAANDVANKNGKARKIRVKITDKNGLDIELVAINKNATRKPYPKAEDKLKVLGLTDKVSEDLLNKIKNGDINSNHINDIQNLNMTDKITKLDPETQNEAVKNIIENRNEKTSINCEEMSSFIIRSGYEDQFTLETWYKGMIRLIKKLSQHADVGEDVITKLYEEQQSNLKAKVAHLVHVLDRLISKCNEK